MQIDYVKDAAVDTWSTSSDSEDEYIKSSVKTRMDHKDFNLSIWHELNEVAKTKQTLLVCH